MEDIREEGPKGLKGLNTREGSIRESSNMGNSNTEVPNINIAQTEQETPFRKVSPKAFRQMYLEEEMGRMEDPIQGVGAPGVGNSWYDRYISSLSQLDDLEDLRANEQGWYNKVLAGVGKATVLAGTTFLEGTAGLVWSIGSVINNGDWNSFVNNDFSNVMQDINEWSEEFMPNYYTEEQRDAAWYDPVNLVSANMLGDKLLKNTGFMVGAYLSGKAYATLGEGIMGLNKARDAFKGLAVASKVTPQKYAAMARGGKEALDAVKITSELAKDAKKLKHAGTILQIIGNTTGAIGEAKIEAVSGVRERMQEAEEKINQLEFEAQQEVIEEMEANGISPIIQQENGFGHIDYVIDPELKANFDDRVKAKFDKEATLAKAQEEAEYLSNYVFLGNFGLLSITNSVLFRGMFSKGYGTSRRLKNIKKVVKDGQISYAKNFSKLRTAKTIASTAFSEGVIEEMGQNMISAIPNTIMDKRMTSFIEGKTNEEASITSADLLNAFIVGFQDSYLNLDAWEEGFIGAVSASLGVPRFRKFRKKSGKLQSPITLEGGTLGDIKSVIQRRREANKQVEELNALMQKDRFINYFEGMTHHNHTENLKNEAVKEGNKFAYHNANDSQIIGDLITADKAGRIDDYFEQISYFENVTESDVEEIKKVFENKKDPNKSIFKGQTDAEIVADIRERAARYKKIANNYMELVEQVQIKYGDTLNQGAMEEIIYYSNKAELLEDRFQKVGKEVMDNIGEASDISIKLKTRIDEKVDDKKTWKDLSWSERIEQFFDKIKRDNRYFTDEYGFKGKDIEISLQEAVNEGPAFLAEAIVNASNREELLTEILAHLPKNKVEDFLENLTDLTSLRSLRSRYIDLLMRYESDPEALNKRMDAIEEERKTRIEEEDKETIKKDLKKSKSPQEFEKRVDELNEEHQDPDETENIVKDLEKEGDENAKYYNESRAYSHAVTSEIQNQEVSESHKAMANIVWNNHRQTSKSMDDLANPNSDMINNKDKIFEDGVELNEDQDRELRTVQYTILNAMHNVNNSERFAKNFSDEYKKMNPKGEKNPMKEQGDFREDGKDRSTIPPVNNPVKLPITYKDKVKIEDMLPAIEDIGPHNSMGEFIEALEEAGFEMTDDFKKGPLVIIRDFMLKNKRLQDSQDEIFNNKKKKDYVDPDHISYKDAEKAALDFSEQADKAEQDLQNNRERKTGSKGWYTIIPEYELDNFKKDIFIKFHEAKLKEGKDFTIIYNYLEREGAFKYINEGKLSLGDKIYLIVDPKYQEEQDEKYGTQVFMAVKDGNKMQVVAALPNVDNASNHLGLEETLKDVIKGYKKDESKMYVHDKTVDVAQILNGKIRYTSERNLLRDIHNLPENIDDVVLAVVRNGQLVANNKQIPFSSPLSLNNKEGMVFIMIPNAKREYQPVAVVRERFTKEYYEQEKHHPNAKNNPILNKVEQIAKNLATAKDDTQTFEAKKDIQETFYAPNIHINYLPASKNTPAQISIKEDILDKNGNKQVETVMDRNGRNYQRTVSKGVTIDLEIIKDGQTEERAISDIQTDIINTFTGMEMLPQIDLNSINTPGYNSELIDSGMLSSNIDHYGVLGSFFLTNYLDPKGQEQKADKFKNDYDEKRRKGRTIVNSQEELRDGVKVTVGNKSYYVDLNRDRITDFEGNELNPNNRQQVIDVAHGLYLYSGIENSSNVYDGLALLPDGKTVVNLHTHSTVGGNLAQGVKDALDKRNKGKTKSDAFYVALRAIQDSQGKVNKGATTGEHYFILEDDGKYHAYDRVHKRIGDNWTDRAEHKNNLAKLDEMVTKAEKENTDIDTFIKELEKEFGKPNEELLKWSKENNQLGYREARNLFSDVITGYQSSSALRAGDAVDTIVRDFFNNNEKTTRPEFMSAKAYIDLLDNLKKMKDSAEARGEKFMTNNVVLFHKDAQGNRTAGEVDILAYNEKDKTFSIYDVKTSRRTFIGTASNFNTQFGDQRTTKEQYTLQLSAYKALFENMTNFPVSKIGLFPFMLEYKENGIEGIEYQRYIPLEYNPNVPIAKESKPKFQEKKKKKQIKQARREARKSKGKKTSPVETDLKVIDKNDVSSNEHAFKNSKEGTFNATKNIDGEVITTTVKAQMIDGPTKFGVKTKIARVPNYKKDFKPTPGPRRKILANYDYYLITENGNTIGVMEKISKEANINDVIEKFNEVADNIKEEIFLKISGKSNKITDNFKKEQDSQKKEDDIILSREFKKIDTLYQDRENNRTKSGRYSVNYAVDLIRNLHNFTEEFIGSLGNLSTEQQNQLQVIEDDLAQNGFKYSNLKYKTASELSSENVVKVIQEVKKPEVNYPVDYKVSKTLEPEISLNDKIIRDGKVEIIEYIDTNTKDNNSKKQDKKESDRVEKTEMEDPDTGEIVGSTPLEGGYSLIDLLNDANEESSTEEYEAPDTFLFDEANKERIEGTEEEDFDPDILREVDPNIEYTPIDLQEEISWLEETMPGFLQAGRLQIKKGLINIGSQSKEAWGMFKEGVVVLSDVASRGTVYHEAFHVVFNTLLSTREVELAYNEARKKFGDLSRKSLEEKMAEDFREYVMGIKPKGIGTRIMDFFKRLFAFVSNSRQLTPHLDALYKNINEGRFKEATFSTVASPIFEGNVTIDSPQNLESKLEFLNESHYDTESTEVLSNRQKDLQMTEVNHTFSDLSAELKNSLIEQGMTETIYNDLSQREKESLIICN